MGSAYEREAAKPETPKHPELMEETVFVPNGAAIEHDFCNLHIDKDHLLHGGSSVSIGVYPAGEELIKADGKINFRSEGFSLAVHKTEGATQLFMSVDTDFEIALPRGVIPRPDSPNKRMLTASGLYRVLMAMRYGSIVCADNERQYGGFLGIDTLHRRARKWGIDRHPTDYI
ncbi:MAG TPA: hypothetical protein VFX86_03225 [Candidatus Saccharimonadales bacterium]|nr:hypothetical protein [Candidatus Saccharimonadales bacterium]